MLRSSFPTWIARAIFALAPLSTAPAHAGEPGEPGLRASLSLLF